MCGFPFYCFIAGLTPRLPDRESIRQAIAAAESIGVTAISAHAFLLVMLRRPFKAFITVDDIGAQQSSPQAIQTIEHIAQLYPIEARIRGEQHEADRLGIFRINYGYISFTCV